MQRNQGTQTNERPTIQNAEKEYIQRYRAFLDRSKTERLFITHARALAVETGFMPAETAEKLVPGDAVFFENRKKNLLLAVIGKKPLQEGFNLIAAHVDSPRLDLKPKPVYEEAGLTLLMTQYYGGIKKYQWAAMPLSLIGTVILKNGQAVEVSIGESPDDPVFTIPDLLPHLSKHYQNERLATEVLKGEELQVLFGTSPKALLLEKLKNDFGIDEEDFLSSELEIVPSFHSRDIGLDRSLLGGYGQDDRLCAFAGLEGIVSLTSSTPERTAIVYLGDKEEVNSVGSTGLDSDFLEYCTEQLLSKMESANTTSRQVVPLTNTSVREILWKSKAIAADVTVGYDPVFKAVHEEQNAAKIGKGIVISKFIGGGGKMNCHDADAEYVAEIRGLFSNAGVQYQGAIFGKVDEGGGATVAKFLSAKGLAVINAGPALLGMHSPFEVASKNDILETAKAFKAFLGQIN